MAFRSTVPRQRRPLAAGFADQMAKKPQVTVTRPRAIQSSIPLEPGDRPIPGDHPDGFVAADNFADPEWTWLSRIEGVEDLS